MAGPISALCEPSPYLFVEISCLKTIKMLNHFKFVAGDILELCNFLVETKKS